MTDDEIPKYPALPFFTEPAEPLPSEELTPPATPHSIHEMRELIDRFASIVNQSQAILEGFRRVAPAVTNEMIAIRERLRRKDEDDARRDRRLDDIEADIRQRIAAAGVNAGR